MEFTLLMNFLYSIFTQWSHSIIHVIELWATGKLFAIFSDYDSLNVEIFWTTVFEP